MFELNEEHLFVKQAAKDFAENVLLSGVIDRDENQTFDRELVRQMGELGFLSMQVDPQYGGGGMDTIAYAVAIEEIAKIDASAAVIMSANNSLVCWGLDYYGSDFQKEKFLRPLTTGEHLGAFALSEPEAGSDATHQHTTAIKQGNKYILNGTKNWITNGGSASTYLVVAQTDPEKKHKGINCFIVEKGTPGFTVGKKENKMGIRASDTHSLMFDNVEIPEEQRIGAEGFGFKLAMDTLNGGRIGIAAQALGIAVGAFERALAYSQERKTFGKPIFEHQAIQFKLAQMATKIEAARLLIYKAALVKDSGNSYVKEAAMAKLYAADMAMAVTTDAVQIHGGYGYVKEYHVERMMRDAKITQIYEGTSEIQQVVIARSLIK